MTKIQSFLASLLMSGIANAYQLQTVFNPFTGKLDYIAVSTSTVGIAPAGSNQQLQYNNSGVFGATSVVYWDNSFLNLMVGGNTFASAIPAIMAQDSGGNGSLAVEVSTGTGSVVKGSVAGNSILDFSDLTATPKLFIGKAISGTSPDPIITVVSNPSRTSFAVGIGTPTPAAMLDVNGSLMLETLTANQCVKTDSNNNLVSSGGACGGGGSTTLISSGVAFGSASNAVTQDTNTFVWDNTNKRLGIGVSPPTSTVDVRQNLTSGSLLSLYNTNTGDQSSTIQLLAGFSSLANANHIEGQISTAADSSTGSRLILSATSSAGSLIEGIRVAATESIISTQGDQYGTVELHLQNRDGTNGALFSNVALDLVDFQFKPSAGNKGSFRYEHRGAFIVGAGNSSGEWQISTSNFSGTPIYAGSATTEIVGNLGVNNASPAASLDVVAPTSLSYEARFSTSTTATSFHVAVSTSGHFITNSPKPSVSSCGSVPNGSVVGDDNQGTITVGGGVVTACTLTFASTWGTTPVCTISDNSTAITGDISSLSATAMTSSFSASLGGGLVYYQCGCSGTSCL